MVDLARAHELLALATAVDEAGGAPNEDAARQLRRARDELRPAAELLSEAEPAAALDLVAALASFWQDAGLVDEGRDLTAAVLARATSVDRESDPGWLRRVALGELAAANLAFRQGDQDAAGRHARAAIASAESAEDAATAALGWVDLARIAFRDGDAERIEGASRRALELAGDDTAARRGALHMLAWAAHAAGDLDDARRRFEASLAFRRTLGDRMSIAVEVGNLADIDLERGEIAAAAIGCIDVLTTVAEAENRYLLVNMLPLVAVIAARRRRDVEAAMLFGAAEALAEDAGLTLDPGSGHEATRSEVASRLGRAFEAAIAEGRTSSEAAAIDLALGICRDVR